MLLGFVLSALLVAQAGHSGVVHVSGLGLSRGTSTEGAEGLGGGVEMSGGILNLDVIVTAGGADHLAHHIPEAVPSGIRCDDLTGLLKATPGPVDIVHSRVVEIIVGIADGVEQIGKRGKEVFGSSEKADVLLGLGGVHGLFLLREIPPVRGERSLVLEFEVKGLPLSKGYKSPGFTGLFDGDSPVLIASIPFGSKSNQLAPRLRSVATCIDEVSFEACLVGGGVDVFHEQRIAQPLAHVNQNIRAIFAVASA